MKKFLSLLLAAMMILSVMPVTALADGMEALDLAPVGEVLEEADSSVSNEIATQAVSHTVEYDGGSVEAVEIGTCRRNGGEKMYLAQLPYGATNISAGDMFFTNVYPRLADRDTSLWVENEGFLTMIEELNTNENMNISFNDGFTLPTTNVKGFFCEAYYSDGQKAVIIQVASSESGSETPDVPSQKPMLSGISASAFSGGSTPYTITPEFSGDVKEYNVVVPADANDFYVKLDFASEYPDATAVVSYNTYSGKPKTVQITSNSYVRCSMFVSSSYMNSGTMTITVNSNDDSNVSETYTINAKRSTAVSALKIVDANDSSNVYANPGMLIGTYNYDNIFVPGNAVMSLVPTLKPTSGSAVIEGAVDGVFTPAWVNGECAMKVSVSADGFETSVYTINFKEIPTLQVVTPMTKTEYNSGDKVDLTGLSVKAVYSNSEEIIDLSGDGVKIEPEGALGDTTEKITITYKKATLEIPVTVNGYKFKGSGTKDDPYLLENAEDCVGLSREVSTGKTYSDNYFKITANITLPTDWVPVGGPKEGQVFVPNLHGRNFNYFAGHIDGKNPAGGNFLLTVPKGEKTLLGCVMGGGSLSNLDIYGERINGYGVMEYYVVSPVYGTACMDIDNVNLKSGTHTKMSGYVGGYASGTNVVNITNCTVEEGVVIGDDGSWGDELNQTYSFNFVRNVQYNDMVGSFGGALNGSVRNCKSYATVYGHDYVGGIIGFKGQSMGDCTVENCEFAGKVIATGSYVGGIIGSGYAAASAPNTPLVVIQNCLVSGSVTGGDNVGGVLGGNEKAKACWNNGIGYVRGNLVTGTVSATGENATVGAIIGHLCASNLYNIVKNNYYVEGTAAKGIGAIDTQNADTVYMETEAVSKADLTNGSVVKKLNSAKAGVNPWKQGASAPEFSGSNRVYKISLMGLNGMRPITVQSVKGYEALTNSSYKLTAYYQNGATEAGHVTDGVIVEPDYTKAGVQLCSVIYDGYEHFFGIDVSVNGDPANQTTKTVKFRMLGDTVHAVTKDNLHTYAKGNLVEWIPEVSVRVPENATAYDVFVKAAEAFGVSFVAEDSAYGKYVSSVTKDGVTLDASSNKQSDGAAYCGWMFNVNGNDVYTSLDKTAVNNGDTLNFYFEDDYSLASVKSAIDAINAIPDESAANYDEKVKAAEDSLKYLSPVALEELMADPAYAKLVRARNRAVARVVDELVDKLAPVTLESEAAIKEAREAFDALTPAQKEVLNKDTESKLVAAEKEYNRLVKEAADKKAAKAVDELVNKLAPVTLESGKAIEEARKAFDALTPEQKQFLDKDTESKLVAAENEYHRLVKETADKAAAKEVEDKIAALQPVTKDSGEAIKDARSSYDALTPEQKELVYKEAYDALVKAEKAYSMIVDSNKPDASDKGDKTTGSIIKISATGAEKGEQNPSTGAPAMSIAPAVLVLAAAVLVLKKRG